MRKPTNWLDNEECPAVLELESVGQRLGCSLDDSLIQELVAEKVLATRPSMILLISWPFALNSLLLKGIRLPRDLGEPASIGAKVFKLTNSVIDEHPRSQDPVTDLYHRFHEQDEDVRFIETTLLLMEEGEETNDFVQGEFSFIKKMSLRRLRLRLEKCHYKIVNMGLELLRDQ